MGAVERLKRFAMVRLTFQQQDILDQLVQRGPMRPPEVAVAIGSRDVEDVRSDCEALRMLGLLAGGGISGFWVTFPASELAAYRQGRGLEDGVEMQKEYEKLRAAGATSLSRTEAAQE